MRIVTPGVLVRCSVLLCLSLLGCGPGFDPPSELHSLRVLGVQKDRPYAQPGQRVNLQMLWQDASAFAGRPIKIAWSPPCFDPVGDLYYACFSDPTAFASMISTPDAAPEHTAFDVPTDIISRRPRADASNNAPYGITYVFFALCAGDFTLLPSSADTAFPVGCKDAAGNLLGADDFVAGYTSVYSFQNFSNHNPNIKGFEIDGKPVTQFCLDDDCLALAGSQPPVDFDCADPDQSARCVPACPYDGDPKCQGYRVRPTVDQADPANQDQDDVSAKLLGRKVGEQMWINYYTDAGGFQSPVRLLNDATSGWNAIYGTPFYPPKTPGLSRIWAIVHDNRGGVSWSGITLKVQ